MNTARDLHCSKCVVCNEMEVIGRRKRRFYRFPRESDKCRAWIRAIGMESLIYMPLAELYEQVVCDAHFPPQCFSARGSRMHKVTLPTISQYPSLSDNIMALWPKSAMRVNPPQTCGLSDQPKEANDLLADYEPFIDFNQPLMTSLETIQHNKLYHVKKPGGNSNTIAVPLMTYSSSLEQGTIFAAPEPKNMDFSKLPILKLQYDDETSPSETGNTQTKDFQDDVNVEALIQDKNKNHRDVTNKKVFYGLATSICSNKTVTTKSNKTIKSLNSKKSEMKCKIHSMHYLLSTSQFDKSKIIHQYKPIKRSINPRVPNSELLNVLNTSNTELVNTTIPKEPDTIKDEDSVNESPLEGKLSEWDTGEFTCTELIIDQSNQTKDSTSPEPQSPDTQVADNNDYGLSLAQCIAIVQKEGDQSKKTPITKIDVNKPLMRCTEIIDLIDETN